MIRLDWKWLSATLLFAFAADVLLAPALMVLVTRGREGREGED